MTHIPLNREKICPLIIGIVFQFKCHNFKCICASMHRPGDPLSILKDRVRWLNAGLGKLSGTKRLFIKSNIHFKGDIFLHMMISNTLRSYLYLIKYISITDFFTFIF